MKYIKIFIMFIIVITINGCVYNTDYPSNWKKIKTSNNTKLLINGNFQCFGENVSSSNDSIKKGYLPNILSIDFNKEKCDTIHFLQPKDEFIEVSIIHNKKVLNKKMLFNNKDYFYENGNIVLKGSEGINEQGG